MNQNKLIFYKNSIKNVMRAFYFGLFENRTINQKDIKKFNFVFDEMERLKDTNNLLVRLKKNNVIYYFREAREHQHIYIYIYI